MRNITEKDVMDQMLLNNTANVTSWRESTSVTTELPLPFQAAKLWTAKVGIFTHNYILPFIILIGWIGNTVSFLVMRKLHNRRISCCNYIAALAVSDNLMLLNAFDYWTISAVFNRQIFQWECRTMSWMFHFASMASMIFIIAMTVDRFLAIRFPFKARTLCSTRRARIAILVISVSVTLYTLPYMFTSKLFPAVRTCVAIYTTDPLSRAYNWMNIFLGSIVPFVGLLTMSGFIIRTVRKRVELSESTGSTEKVGKKKGMTGADNRAFEGDGEFQHQKSCRSTKYEVKDERKKDESYSETAENDKQNDKDNSVLDIEENDKGTQSSPDNNDQVYANGHDSMDNDCSNSQGSNDRKHLDDPDSSGKEHPIGTDTNGKGHSNGPDMYSNGPDINGKGPLNGPDTNDREPPNGPGSSTAANSSDNDLSEQGNKKIFTCSFKLQRQNTKVNSKQSRDNQLTMMLLLVTFTFLVLTLPQYVRYLLAIFWNYYANAEDYASFLLLAHASNRIFYVNSACNFFLYCMSGSKFRQDVKDLFTLRKKQHV